MSVSHGDLSVCPAFWALPPSLPPSLLLRWTRCYQSISPSAPVGFCPKLSLVFETFKIFFFYSIRSAGARGAGTTSRNSKVLFISDLTPFFFFLFFFYDSHTSPKNPTAARFVTHERLFVCRPSRCDLTCCQGGALAASINKYICGLQSVLSCATDICLVVGPRLASCTPLEWGRIT